MKTPEDYEKLLPAYVAGVADPADVHEIGEHLAENEDLMNSFQRTVKDLGTLKLWRESSLPEGIASRVLERIVQVQEARRQVVITEQASWGEPIQRGLAIGALALFVLIIGAVLTTAYAGSRYESHLQRCKENLRQVGIAAEAEGGLKQPIGPRIERMAKHLDPEGLVCPIKGSAPDGRASSYLLDLPGPVYRAGDRRENHAWRDAHLLMVDGSVIRVTPSQAELWNVLDPYSTGR